jgi:hypothetical protein
MQEHRYDYDGDAGGELDGIALWLLRD